MVCIRSIEYPSLQIAIATGMGAGIATIGAATEHAANITENAIAGDIGAVIAIDCSSSSL